MESSFVIVAGWHQFESSASRHKQKRHPNPIKLAESLIDNASARLTNSSRGRLEHRQTLMPANGRHRSFDHLPAACRFPSSRLTKRHHISLNLLIIIIIIILAFIRSSSPCPLDFADYDAAFAELVSSITDRYGGSNAIARYDCDTTVDGGHRLRSDTTDIVPNFASHLLTNTTDDMSAAARQRTSDHPQTRIQYGSRLSLPAAFYPNGIYHFSL